MTESMAQPKASRSRTATKGNRTSRAVQPRTPATKSKSSPHAGTKAKPHASQTKRIKARKDEFASRIIDKRLRDPGDWRGETLARMRALILEADPEMIEERKWRKPSNAMAGVP